MAEHEITGTAAAGNQATGQGTRLITLVLLFALLVVTTFGVVQALAGPGGSYLWKSLLLGLLVGWGLATFRLSAWKSALFIFVAGLIFNLLSVGGLAGKTLVLIVEILRLPSHILYAAQASRIDYSGLFQASRQASASLSIVIARIGTWLNAYLAGKPTFDPVAAGFVWSMLVWLVAAWAGWMVEQKRNTLVAVLPALLLNLGVLSYRQSSSTTIYFTLGVTLLLLAIVQARQRQQEWNAARVAYPSWKNRQVGSAALLIAIGLVIVSAFVSSLSIERVAKWTSEFRKPSNPPKSGLAKSLGIQQATTIPDSFSTVRSPGLPRDLLIGSGSELSGELVMSVQVKDLASLTPSGQQLQLYWRSFTYDIYTGHGWSSSDTQQTLYDPGQTIQPALPGHLLIQQTIRPAADLGGTVYAAGEPRSLDVPSNAAWRSSSDLFGIQTGFNGYTVQSLVPIIDEVGLRAAGTDYPSWVTSRYLALPDEIPSRVKDLSLQLTASQPTPYDRARAIENYLRDYPYTLDVSRPALSQDLVDYFLFDLRKGYCDYYASAMVVLARMAGIPARLAVGYASGTYNLNSDLFQVTQADAHSWPELYFPNIGWVPFEPTAARPAFNRPVIPTPEATPNPSFPIPIKYPARSNPARTVGIAGLILITLAGSGWAGFDELRLRRMQPQSAAVEIYRRLKRYGKTLHIAIEPGQTPYEFAESMGITISGFHTHTETSNTGSSVTQGIQSVARLVVRLVFRPSEPQHANKIRLLSEWRALRWRLRWAWVLQGWTNIQVWAHRLFGRLFPNGNEPTNRQAGKRE